METRGLLPESAHHTLYLRLLNDSHVVSLFYRWDGEQGTRYACALKFAPVTRTSRASFSSLRPMLCAAGTGAAKFKNLKYRALP